eukprot:TRINITY_DN48191_c0_g1_i1.p3 TRINITY_DN48191_c0_g1~~TRINITY_DN48191_c0_g1_i1.p3  ORF type:complete len:167 (-),score=29.57 TRINITY_DN48191_c0_g1_i1:279-716(-)
MIMEGVKREYKRIVESGLTGNQTASKRLKQKVRFDEQVVEIGTTSPQDSASQGFAISDSLGVDKQDGLSENLDQFLSQFLVDEIDDLQLTDDLQCEQDYQIRHRQHELEMAGIYEGHGTNEQDQEQAQEEGDNDNDEQTEQGISG